MDQLETIYRLLEFVVPISQGAACEDGSVSEAVRDEARAVLVAIGWPIGEPE